MDNWLKNRLSPVKIETPSWQQLAESIEQYWEENFDPAFEHTANLKSVYTADEEGIQKIIHELGSYYEDDLATDNIPLSVAQRKYELCLKGATDPLNYTLKRLGIDAYWAQLYARTEDDYGDEFYLDWEMDPEKNHFLTSRGKVCVNLATIQTEFAAKIDVLRRRINHVKPLHIFFQGFHYFLALFINIPVRAMSSMEMQKHAWVSGWPWNALRLDGTWVLDGSEVLEQRRVRTEFTRYQA